MNYRSDRLLSDVAMATNFRVKVGKVGLFTFIRSPGVPKRIAILPV